ncbi:hypothetical protein [Actinomadura sp. 6N118]|uniref:hypothetical protein n=1 Tax=Actinomadura sp. 6N118 TaxID=3375151 RepID=UPI003793227D
MSLSVKLGTVALTGVATLSPMVATGTAHAEVAPAAPAAASSTAASATAGYSAVRLADLEGQLTSAGREVLKAAPNCVYMWRPYKQKFRNGWHTVIGGKLKNCGATYFKVTLQQKRWWGWDGRSSKTIYRKGSVNPKAKCKSSGTYTWRAHGNWYRRTPRGSETLWIGVTKTTRHRC